MSHDETNCVNCGEGVGKSDERRTDKATPVMHMHTTDPAKRGACGALVPDAQLTWSYEKTTCAECNALVRHGTSDAFPTETCDACLEGARFGDSFVKSPHTCRKNTEYYCGHSAQDYEIRNGSLTCTECGPRSETATAYQSPGVPEPTEADLRRARAWFDEQAETPAPTHAVATLIAAVRIEAIRDALSWQEGDDTSGPRRPTATHTCRPDGDTLDEWLACVACQEERTRPRRESDPNDVTVREVSAPAERVRECVVEGTATLSIRGEIPSRGEK